MPKPRASRKSLALEALRKSTHLLFGTAVVLSQFFLEYWQISAIAAAGIPVAWLLHRHKPLGEVQTLRESWGEVATAAGISATALLFPHPGPFTFGVLAFMFSDSAASLVGKWFGRTRIYERKTMAGAVAFAVSALIIGWATLAVNNDGTIRNFIVMIPMVVALTGIEIVSGKGWDNLTIPLAAAAGYFVFMT